VSLLYSRAVLVRLEFVTVIYGVPTLGMIDTRADITIMGGELSLFKIAKAARLKKKHIHH